MFVDLPRDTPELGAEIVAMQHLGEALVNDPATQAVWDSAVDPLWQIGEDFGVP